MNSSKEKASVIETERLLLQPISVDDAGLIFEMYNMPAFIEFIGDRNICSTEDAEKYITEKFLPQIERLGFGNYLIVRKADHQKVGAVGIFERDGLDIHDIGFSLLREFEGNGYAFEAAKTLIDKAFSSFGLHKISAITTNTNFPSQRLIEKLGLQFVKTLHLPNDDEELRYYELANQQ